MFIARSDEKPRSQFNLIARERARYFAPAACAHIFETHPSGHLRAAALDARAEQRVRYLFVMRIAIRRAAASVIVIASERARAHNEPYD